MFWAYLVLVAGGFCLIFGLYTGDEFLKLLSLIMLSIGVFKLNIYELREDIEKLKHGKYK